GSPSMPRGWSAASRSCCRCCSRTPSPTRPDRGKDTTMTARPERRLAGTLLILVPIAFTVCFTLLQLRFEYPAILRQPTADILTKFQAGGASLVAIWYALTLTALLFIPIAVLLHRVLAERAAPAALWVATVFGVVAGLAQGLGFLRWPFLVPHLARVYL